VIPGIFRLTHVQNQGAAFGLFAESAFEWKVSMLVLFSLAALAVVSALLWKNGNALNATAIALSLVFGGALGNLMDRIFRAPGPLSGHVVDMVSPFAPNGEAFAVFNLADSAITCGGVLLVLLALLGHELDGTKARKGSSDA
jgi:signal peptidase II